MNLKLVRKKKSIIFKNGNYESYRKKVEKFEEMTNLSKELIEKLNGNYYIDNLEILKKQVSVDGTKKYLIKLPTGGAIESVLMNYNYRIYNMCINTKGL